MTIRTFLPVASITACVLLASPAAFAVSKPDLATSITVPSGVHVYDSGAYVFTVANVGTKNATGATMQIQLPETNTSPQVYVMGTLGAFGPSCTRSGTVLNCTLGAIAKGTSKSVTVNIALPYASDPLVFDATVPPVVGETNTGNNDASAAANLLTYDVTFAAAENATNRHCTGTTLTSFFECELFPSSIASFDSVLETDGSVTLVGAPAGFGGNYSLPTPDHLLIDYYDTDGPAGSLDAWGTSADCWEGIMTFPGSSPYVAPYEVCLQ